MDTSFAIALNATDDQWHGAASRAWEDVLANRVPLITTTFILDEVVGFLNARGRHALAVEVGTQFLSGAAIGLVHVDESLLAQRWEFFARHDDKRYSLTDCISFVVMEQRGLRQALSFDRHFVQAGFECVPEAGSGV